MRELRSQDAKSTGVLLVDQAGNYATSKQNLNIYNREHGLAVQCSTENSNCIRCVYDPAQTIHNNAYPFLHHDLIDRAYSVATRVALVETWRASKLDLSWEAERTHSYHWVSLDISNLSRATVRQIPTPQGPQRKPPWHYIFRFCSDVMIEDGADVHGSLPIRS